MPSEPERALESFRLLRPQGLILSLCDYTGAWSQPYEDDGYEVVRIDVQHGQDVRLLELPDKPVHGILAAPPCTMFANSGARWERSTDDMLSALSVVDACCRIILASTPAWWVLENPPGKLSRYLGPPRWTFNPNDYCDDYTKFTCLWGDFLLGARCTACRRARTARCCALSRQQVSHRRSSRPTRE